MKFKGLGILLIGLMMFAVGFNFSNGASIGENEVVVECDVGDPGNLEIVGWEIPVIDEEWVYSMNEPKEIDYVYHADPEFKEAVGLILHSSGNEISNEYLTRIKHNKEDATAYCNAVSGKVKDWPLSYGLSYRVV